MGNPRKLWLVDLKSLKHDKTYNVSFKILDLGPLKLFLQDTLTFWLGILFKKQDIHLLPTVTKIATLSIDRVKSCYVQKDRCGTTLYTSSLGVVRLSVLGSFFISLFLASRLSFLYKIRLSVCHIYWCLVCLLSCDIRCALTYVNPYRVFQLAVQCVHNKS